MNLIFQLLGPFFIGVGGFLLIAGLVGYLITMRPPRGRR